MKKTFTILFSAIVLQSCLFAQGIEFIEALNDSDLAVADDRAKAENKFIFIDCYTTWCGPCKWMEKNVFSNDTIGKFYNKNFICVRLDMENQTGRLRTFKYEVYSYPTMLFIKDGEVLHRASGSMATKDFIALGETALNPEKRLEHWTKQYREGKREPAFIREYLKQLQKAGMETKEVSDWYFVTQSDKELLTNGNFEMIEMSVDGYYVGAPNNRLFDLVLSNKEKYCEIVGKETVEKMIYKVFENAPYFDYKVDSATREYVPVYENGTIEKIIEKINQTDFAGKEKLITNLNIALYYQKKDWKKYVEQSAKFVNAYGLNDVQTLNNYAWSFYENAAITEKADLELALNWAKKSVELDSQFFNNDTQIAVLYKLGRKKEAMAATEKMLELLKKDGQDTAPAEEWMEKIKQMK